jgi:hypothetical protein
MDRLLVRFMVFFTVLSSSSTMISAQTTSSALNDLIQNCSIYAESYAPSEGRNSPISDILDNSFWITAREADLVN